MPAQQMLPLAPWARAAAPSATLEDAVRLMAQMAAAITVPGPPFAFRWDSRSPRSQLEHRLQQMREDRRRYRVVPVTSLQTMLILTAVLRALPPQPSPLP